MFGNRSFSGARRCDGVSRRDLVRVGGITTLGAGLAGFGIGDFFRMRRAAAADGSVSANTASRAKSCILIWLDGGPTHLESFDPKPDAPSEVRGPMETVATSIPGVRLGECLQQTAKLMDQLAIVRSMTSPLGEHNFGSHYLLTGYKPSPALAYPTFGATLAHVRGNEGVLPPNIAVPKFSRNVSGRGFLSNATEPFAVGGNPGKPDFQVRDLDFYNGLDLQRLDRRKQMVDALDRFASEKDASVSVPGDTDLQRAYELIASQDAKAAFDLGQEPEHIRNRYGRGGGTSIGQSCLLARRLVERGVPFVTVTSNGWDTHQNLLNLKHGFLGIATPICPRSILPSAAWSPTSPSETCWMRLSWL